MKNKNISVNNKSNEIYITTAEAFIFSNKTNDKYKVLIKFLRLLATIRLE